MNLSAGQIAYLTQQRIGRLATVRPDGQPQVNPVSCYYNPGTGTIDISGHNMAESRKYRNVSLHPLRPAAPRPPAPFALPGRQADEEMLRALRLILMTSP